MLPIPLFKPFMSPAAVEAAAKVLTSGQIGQGDKVVAFERAVAEYVNADYVVATDSCTSALQIALTVISERRSCDGEVLTTPLTCIATNTAILAAGMKLKWVDVNGRLGMDVGDLKRKLSPRTTAVMVAHWGGMPNDIDAIHELNDASYREFGRRFYLIEDCAHAFGSVYKSARIGRPKHHYHMLAFSFGGVKTLTTVEGGMLTMYDENLRELAVRKRWYGLRRDRSLHYAEQMSLSHGMKANTTDVNAAIGLANLPHVGELIGRQRSNALYYLNSLGNVPGLTLVEPTTKDSSWWLFTVLVERREDFIAHMKSHGIHCDAVHWRNDKYTIFREYRSFLPGLDSVADRYVCIPCGWWLTTPEREFVVHCIRKGW